MRNESKCPNCAGEEIYMARDVSSGGGYGPRLLPGLGPFLSVATFTLLVCADCGLTRLLASEEACAKLGTSALWSKVPSS